MSHDIVNFYNVPKKVVVNLSDTKWRNYQVRHINFHSFHTKIKCHGLNMLTSHGLQPCLLDPAQRNIVPDLSELLQCDWLGCQLGSHLDWELPHQFYAHVAGHAEEVSCNLVIFL